MNNTPTIRIQKVRKNRTKRMFIIFSILAAALLICSIIAPLLCPYDPLCTGFKQVSSAAISRTLVRY